MPKHLERKENITTIAVDNSDTFDIPDEKSNRSRKKDFFAMIGAGEIYDLKALGLYYRPIL